MEVSVHLRIDNIGKVETAQIEIEGVTVLTGYNGTGKTSICRALYGVTDSFSDINKKLHNLRRNSMMDVAMMLAHGIKEEDNILSSSFYELRDDIMSFINSESEYKVDFFSRDLIDALCIKNKVVLSDEIINNFLNRINEVIQRDADEYLRFYVSRTIKTIFRNQIGNVNLNKPSGIIFEDNNTICEIMYKDDDLVGLKHAVNILMPPIYIEPENVLEGYDLFKRTRRRQSRPSFAPYLTEKSESSLSDLTLEQYENLEKNTRLIKRILNETTHGRLEDEQNSLMLTYHEEGINENISCGNIASGLKLFLIIQRLVENGSLCENRLLIIDEPEVNLHPEWQLKLARILVLLNTQMGVRVVLSTHSPYFLKAVDYYLHEENKCDVGHFYLTKETTNGLYTVEDVTNNKELIYKTMYKPLEELE